MKSILSIALITLAMASNSWAEETDKELQTLQRLTI